MPTSAEELARQWAAMIEAIARRKFGDRPDSYQPRKVPRCLRRYPRLTEPRAAARRRLKEEVKSKGKKALGLTAVPFSQPTAYRASIFLTKRVTKTFPTCRKNP
jgi:hypothetical protein